MTPLEPDCTTCGACCACYRVDFSRFETEPHSDGAPHTGCVPIALTHPLTPHTVRMQGTDDHPPRCIALIGTVGESVRCSLYAVRPGPCRELEPGSEVCWRARRVQGLPTPPPL